QVDGPAGADQRVPPTAFVTVRRGTDLATGGDAALHDYRGRARRPDPQVTHVDVALTVAVFRRQPHVTAGANAAEGVTRDHVRLRHGGCGVGDGYGFKGHEALRRRCIEP